MARSVGYKKDLRLSKKHSYSNYNQFTIKSFLGINGDCYDRYLIRMLEMGESLNIIKMHIKEKSLRMGQKIEYGDIFDFLFK